MSTPVSAGNPLADDQAVGALQGMLEAIVRGDDRGLARVAATPLEGFPVSHWAAVWLLQRVERAQAASEPEVRLDLERHALAEGFDLCDADLEADVREAVADLGVEPRRAEVQRGEGMVRAYTWDVAGEEKPVSLVYLRHGHLARWRYLPRGLADLAPDPEPTERHYCGCGCEISAGRATVSGLCDACQLAGFCEPAPPGLSVGEAAQVTCGQHGCPLTDCGCRTISEVLGEDLPVTRLERRLEAARASPQGAQRAGGDSPPPAAPAPPRASPQGAQQTRTSPQGSLFAEAGFTTDEPDEPEPDDPSGLGDWGKDGWPEVYLVNCTCGANMVCRDEVPLACKTCQGDGDLTVTRTYDGATYVDGTWRPPEWEGEREKGDGNGNGKPKKKAKKKAKRVVHLRHEGASRCGRGKALSEVPADVTCQRCKKAAAPDG